MSRMRKYAAGDITDIILSEVHIVNLYLFTVTHVHVRTQTAQHKTYNTVKRKKKANELGYSDLNCIPSSFLQDLLKPRLNKD